MSKVIPAKPTIYNQIRYRSRLEAMFARWLDTQGVLFEYEPSGFETEPSANYSPDFFLTDPYLNIYIEIKPEPLFAEMALFQDSIEMSQMRFACVDSPARGLWRMYWINPALYFDLNAFFPRFHNSFSFEKVGLWRIKLEAPYFEVCLRPRDDETQN